MNADRTSPNIGQLRESESQQKTTGEKDPSPNWNRFLSLLPSIRRYAEFRFRNHSPESREEMVQETVSRALVDYHRLRERGKEHLAYAGPLAKYAVSQVRQGRRVGCRLNAQDISSEFCQRRRGVLLESLDRRHDASDNWLDILVEDRSSTPAEIAGARIDVCEWLKTLPTRSRRLAERLGMGESTSGAARMFGISPARVSQLRSELHRAWNDFQGESASSLL